MRLSGGPSAGRSVRGGGGRFVAVAVADTGIGMEPSEMSGIFEAFRQVDDSVTRKAGGSGLGLAIAHRFSKMLEGSLTAESRRGEGSTFTVTLPLADADGRAEAGAAAGRDGAETGAETAAHGEHGGPGPAILCIDDDPEAAELLRGYLADEGYRVVCALGGEEGIRMAERLDPLAITLDIRMPGKDGWAVIGELKKNPATRHIPVVIVTITDSKALGFRVGAADFLQKPIAPEALVPAYLRMKVAAVPGSAP